MIIKNGNNNDVLTMGMEETISMTIDESDKEVLMMILSEGLYSDPVGSIVRELSSNALDATREMGSEEPIIVSLKEVNGEYWFKVQDFGIGMSPERIENVYSKYASSTKRGDNNQLGYFGLGGKSPLAYTNSFLIDTIYDGVLYQYIMYKSEGGTKIDLLASRETKEKNGTIIAIKIKKDDYFTFSGKIKEQLAYFEGVYFDVDYISNDFKIITTEDWKYSGLSEDTNLHICLDNVYYKLNERIEIPIALNFKVSDGLVPTPNREQIRMTSSTIKLIQDKIAKVADYFIGEYNNKFTKDTNIISIWNEIGKSYKYVVISNETFCINSLVKYASIKPKEIKLSCAPDIDLGRLCNKEAYILKEYICFGKIVKNKYSTRLEDSEKYIGIGHIIRGVKFILVEDTVTNVQIDYLKSIYSSVYLIRKVRDRKLGRIRDICYFKEESSYINILSLRDIPRANWRSHIQQFQAIMKSITDKFIAIGDLKPTAEFLEERKRNRKKATVNRIDKLEIHPKIARKAERGDNYTTFDSSKPLSLDELPKQKFFTVYGGDEDIKRLDGLYHIYCSLKSSKPFRVVLLCNRDIKKLKERNIHNWISINKFMDGKTKAFSNFCTRMLISDFINTNYKLFKLQDVIRRFSKTLADDMKSLYSFSSYTQYNQIESELKTYMMELCEREKLWDTSIIDVLDRVKRDIKVFDFICYLDGRTTLEDTNLQNFIREVLKSRKFQMDAEHYQIKN